MATPPVTPQGQFTPGGQLGALSAIRGQSVSANAIVTLSPDTPALSFPPIAGFGLVLQLHSPSPTPTATPARSGHKKSTRGVSVAAARPTPSPSPSPSPSESPTPQASDASPEAEVHSRKKHRGAAAPSASPHQVSLTFTVYPDSAPAAPTAPPSTQPVLQRHVLLLGNFHAEDAVTLPSLSALSFTVAKREQLTGRGFTVAIFEERKRRKTTQLAFDKDAVMSAAGVVRSTLSAPAIPLEADHRYVFVLYADDPPPSVSMTSPPVMTTTGSAPMSISSPGLSPAPSVSASGSGGIFSGSTLQGGGQR